jgi:hypothetical protein
MPPPTTRASTLDSTSLRWAVRLLVVYAGAHAVRFAFLGIQWELSTNAALIAAILLSSSVVLPLILAAGLRARAQWAWYFTLLFAGWYALRPVLAMGVSLMSPGVTADLLIRRVPTTLAVVVLCISIIYTLTRPDARAACGVRAG